LLGYGSKVGIDATRKWRSEGFSRDWPREIVMSDEIKELVSRRWSEYGLDQVASPERLEAADLIFRR